MVNSPSIRPYLLGGVALGGTLDSHDKGLTKCTGPMVDHGPVVVGFGFWGSTPPP